MMTQNRSEWMTVLDAAGAAGVSEMTVRRAVAAGTLRYKGYRGATKLFRREDVEAWIARRNEVTPFEPAEGGDSADDAS